MFVGGSSNILVYSNGEHYEVVQVRTLADFLERNAGY